MRNFYIVEDLNKARSFRYIILTNPRIYLLPNSVVCFLNFFSLAICKLPFIVVTRLTSYRSIFFHKCLTIDKRLLMEVCHVLGILDMCIV